ncbi:MAG: hypothetical protein LIO87_07040 [Eubacterium sp.]|nr:hypothetical protein [Eubacterium sp.]
MKKPKLLYPIIYFIITAAIFAALLFTASRSKSAFIKEYSTISASRSNMAANYISSYLTVYGETLSGVAELDCVKGAIEGNPIALDETASLLVQGSVLSSGINSVSVLDIDKNTICSTDQTSVDIPDMDEILSRAETGAVMSDVKEYQGENIFIIAVPVFENKVLKGYIVSEISLEVFSKTHGNLLLNRDSGFILFDGEGRAFTLTDGKPSEYTYEDLKSPKKSGDLKDYFIGESEIYFENLGSGWSVFYLLSGSSLISVFNRFYFTASAVCLIMILIGVFAIIKIKKGISDPLRETSEEIEKMCGDKSYSLLEIDSEFEALSALKNSVNEVIRGMMNGEAAVLFLMKKYAGIFEEKKIVFIKWDLTTLKFTISPIYREIFGIDFIPYGSKGFSPERLGIHPDDAARFNDMLKDIRLGRKTAPAIFKKKTADGKYRYFEYTFSIACDSYSSPVSALGCIMDVDRFVRTETALRRAAELDRYTGVYNKYTFMQSLKEGFLKAKETGESMCISMVKLHNFYSLEDDNIGAGEEALKFMANVISENIECTIGRILTDSLGVYSTAENLVFHCDQIMKELNLGFYSKAADETLYTQSTSAMFISDDIAPSFDLLISKCVKEYERFKPSAQNTYYFADATKKD